MQARGCQLRAFRLARGGRCGRGMWRHRRNRHTPHLSRRRSRARRRRSRHRPHQQLRSGLRDIALDPRAPSLDCPLSIEPSARASSRGLARALSRDFPLSNVERQLALFGRAQPFASPLHDPARRAPCQGWPPATEHPTRASSLHSWPSIERDGRAPSWDLPRYLRLPSQPPGRRGPSQPLGRPASDARGGAFGRGAALGEGAVRGVT